MKQQRVRASSWPVLYSCQHTCHCNFHEADRWWLHCSLCMVEPVQKMGATGGGTSSHWTLSGHKVWCVLAQHWQCNGATLQDLVKRYNVLAM